jgi:acyl carrier protein
MMTLDAFLKELEVSIENAEPGSIAADARFRDLAWWDSLAALSTLAVVDGCFGKQISADQLAGCDTFADIYRVASR